jgi:hypothetical protein
MIYRTVDGELLGARRDRLLDVRRLEAAALLSSQGGAVDVYRRRFTRCAFGLAGIVMAALLVDAAATGGVPLVPILDASWLAAGLVVLLGRPAALLALRRELGATFAPTDDPAGDLVALEGLSAERAIAAAADRLEQRSVALPLAALALLLPLTLHRVAGLLLGTMGATPLASMDSWIRASMVLVGHCHLLLLLCACLFARDLRRHPDFPEEQLALRAGWGAFAWTSLASIPAATLCLALWPLEGWVLFVLVPTLVTVTGLAFIPSAFRAAGRAIARERAEIRPQPRYSPAPCAPSCS